MVDKFQKILEKIITEKGEVVFFGIFKMDELTDKWSVLFSAGWLNENNRDVFFSYLLNIINTELTEEESKSIARIGVFSSDDHLISLLLDYKKGSRIQNQPINGNIIHEGYIFASNREIESEIIPLN